MKLLLTGIIALAASQASAATLTFDGDICIGGTSCSNGDDIDQSYGDMAGVDVIYDANASDVTLTPLNFWSSQYSNLTNVAYGDNASVVSQIVFKALAGAIVTVSGFELGAWPNSDRPSSWEVFDIGTNAILDSSGPITVSGTTALQVAGTWSSAVGIGINFGPDSFNVGIDNIQYSVANVSEVPLPASGILLLAGLGGISMVRRRKS